MFIPGHDFLPRVIRCMGTCYRSRAEGRFCAAYTTGSFRSLYSYSGHSSRPKGERGVVRASYRSPCAHVPTALPPGGNVVWTLLAPWRRSPSSAQELPRAGPCSSSSHPTSGPLGPSHLETHEVVTHTLGHIPTPLSHPRAPPSPCWEHPDPDPGGSPGLSTPPTWWHSISV